jgi:uncharacterized RDD family membrane protein YckC
MRPTPYAGLVTRAIALLVDVVVIDVIALITGAVLALIGSLLGIGHLGIAAALTGGILWFGWTGLYFIVFWIATGQTPGARLLGVRVVSESPRPLGIVRASLRFIVMMLALIPLGAGYLTVLFDDRRRGPHDMIAATAARWASPIDAPVLAEFPASAPGRASAPATAPAPAPAAPAGSAGTPPRAATAPLTAAAPPSAPATDPARSPLAPGAATAHARSPSAPGAATAPAPSPPAAATAPPPTPVVGEVVGPPRDDKPGGRVPPSGWDRPRLATDQPPPTRFDSRPGS